MMAAARSVLPVPVAISNRNRSLPSFTARCKRVNGIQLVGPQKSQVVCLDVAWALRLVAPSRFGLIVRALCQDDVVIFDALFDEALWVRRDLLVSHDRLWSRKGRDEIGIAAFQIPEIVQDYRWRE